MEQSFQDREDPHLLGKLLTERPGILNLALDELDRVRQHGLRQHESGVGSKERLEELTSPIVAFVNECCLLGPEYSETVDSLFNAFKIWCIGQEISFGWGKNSFSEKLRSAYSKLTDSRPRQQSAARPTVLNGIGLHPKSPKRVSDMPAFG
jgi:putative DNA primase/helicase